MNGDGIPDIVAPPARLGGDAGLHIWIGDGKGHFTPLAKLTFPEDGKPSRIVSRRLRRRRRRGHRRRRQARRRRRPRTAAGSSRFFGDGKGTFRSSRGPSAAGLLVAGGRARATPTATGSSTSSRPTDVSRPALRRPEPASGPRLSLPRQPRAGSSSPTASSAASTPTRCTPGTSTATAARTC